MLLSFSELKIQRTRNALWVPKREIRRSNLVRINHILAFLFLSFSCNTFFFPITQEIMDTTILLNILKPLLSSNENERVHAEHQIKELSQNHTGKNSLKRYLIQHYLYFF
jgi:hypothetical protein